MLQVPKPVSGPSNEGVTSNLGGACQRGPPGEALRQVPKGCLEFPTQEFSAPQSSGEVGGHRPAACPETQGSKQGALHGHAFFLLDSAMGEARCSVQQGEADTESTAHTRTRTPEPVLLQPKPAFCPEAKSMSIGPCHDTSASTPRAGGTASAPGTHTFHTAPCSQAAKVHEEHVRPLSASRDMAPQVRKGRSASGHSGATQAEVAKQGSAVNTARGEHTQVPYPVLQPPKPVCGAGRLLHQAHLGHDLGTGADQKAELAGASTLPAQASGHSICGAATRRGEGGEVTSSGARCLPTLNVAARLAEEQVGLLQPRPVFPKPEPQAPFCVGTAQGWATPRFQVDQGKPEGQKEPDISQVTFQDESTGDSSPCLMGQQRLAGPDAAGSELGSRPQASTQLDTPTTLAEESRRICGATLWPFKMGFPGTVAQAVRALSETDSLILAFDGALRAIPQGAQIEAGQEFYLWKPVPQEDQGMPLGFRTLNTAAGSFDHVMAPTRRRAILAAQKGWVTDDQAAFALKLIARCAPRPVRILHPLSTQILLDDADVNGMCKAVGPLHDGESFATMFLVESQWIAACWSVQGDTVLAWSTASTGGAAGEAVGAADSPVAKALDRQIHNFRFYAAPSRPPAHGLCGHFALADLLHYILGTVPPGADQALHCAALLSAAFEISLRNDCLVQAPVMIGGGPEAGLAAILREHGVPPPLAGERAVAAIQTIGKANVQKALEGPQAWKELKAIATSSKFQLVLPSEMQAVAEARGPQRRRQRKDYGNQKRVAPAQDLLQRMMPPAPESIRIPDGVFVKDDGGCLSRSPPQKSGPRRRV